MKKAILLAILGLFLCFGQASATLYYPTQDTMVSSGSTAAFNPGDLSSYLYTGGAFGSTTLLKFNVSSLYGQTITAATLNLYSGGTFSFVNQGTTAYYSADGSWTEALVPLATVSGATAVIGSNTTAGSVAGWHTWNLFPLLTEAMLADGTLSIVIKESGPAYSYHLFNDSEHANSPYLSVTAAAPVPIPAAIWLLGSGLIGLIGIRRRFRK